MERAGARRRRTAGRCLPWVVALVATALLVVTAPGPDARRGSTAAEVLGGDQLRIMAPAAPGGGWDQTAREMQGALTDLVGRTEVHNVAGAGGTIGLSQFGQYRDDPTELMATGLIMMGAAEANDAPASLADTTPLVRLTTDAEVLVVPADSPVRSVDDLVRRMRADLPAVSIGGGSAGGAEHILAGLLAEEVGRDPARISYVAHSGGGELLSTVLSGRCTFAISGLSEVEPQIRAGELRALAVSSPERSSTLPQVPTLREQGLDVVLDNWRGVVAPRGIDPEQERALEQLLLEMTRTPQWHRALENRGWGDAALAGPEFEEFIRTEQERVTQVLDRIGLG